MQKISFLAQASFYILEILFRFFPSRHCACYLLSSSANFFASFSFTIFPIKLTFIWISARRSRRRSQSQLNSEKRNFVALQGFRKCRALHARAFYGSSFDVDKPKVKKRSQRTREDAPLLVTNHFRLLCMYMEWSSQGGFTHNFLRLERERDRVEIKYRISDRTLPRLIELALGVKISNLLFAQRVPIINHRKKS